MQNKANFPDIQMNVSDAITMNYEIFTTYRAQKTKPIQTQLKPKQSQNKPNFLDVQMNVNIYYTKVYNNETAFWRRQNKPNQTQFARRLNERKFL